MCVTQLLMLSECVTMQLFFFENEDQCVSHSKNINCLVVCYEYFFTHVKLADIYIETKEKKVVRAGIETTQNTV